MVREGTRYARRLPYQARNSKSLHLIEMGFSVANLTETPSFEEGERHPIKK